jgi:hypothetical protein
MNGKTKARRRAAAQITLGGLLLTAGIGHLTFAREMRRRDGHRTGRSVPTDPRERLTLAG